MTVCIVTCLPKNTVYTLYVPINVWFWPTLQVSMQIPGTQEHTCTNRQAYPWHGKLKAHTCTSTHAQEVRAFGRLTECVR